MSAAVDAFLTKKRATGLRRSSLQSYEERLELILDLETTGDRSIRWLRNRGDALYEHAQIDHAPDTHRNALAMGKMFGRFCVKQGWLKADPFADVEGVGRRRCGKPQLGVDEAKRLTDLCLSLGAKPEPVAVLAALILGPRASEVIERDVRDLDDSGRLLWIRESKTEAGKRCVEVPDMLTPLLLELARDRIAAAPLFWDRHGERPTRHWVLYHCRRLCRAAKDPVISVHGLRGTHSSLAKRGGATGAVVAAQLGHESPAITNRAYIASQAASSADASAVARTLAGNSVGTRLALGTAEPSK